MPPPGVCLNILENRHKQHGYGSISKPRLLFSQDHQRLKDFCATRRVKFIDDMFPPDSRSVGQGLLSPSDLDQVVWLRPAKIAHNPSFVLRGFSRFDFGQGLLGNCWFLASIGALTFQDSIFRQVVPLDQGFDENYCGLFHFRFWRFGSWVDVVIDDKLPTINGRLIFVQSKNQNEFWPALLEKAYAKVCGSYTDMNAGTPAEAMVDFTGGVHMCIQLSDPPPDLWELMSRAGICGALLASSTPQGTSSETLSPKGLVQGHAYTVTSVIQIMSRGKPVKMVRLWNPWGKGEWNGDWSDRSSLWQTVSSQDREKCLSVSEDGEFWMSLEDYCKFYADLDICGLNPNFLDEDPSCHWRISMAEGRWVAGTTAGGCMNHRESFWTNPQFRVKVGGDSSKGKAEKNMLVSLMQKPDKRNRRLVQNLHIGFSIFQVEERFQTHKGKFTASFFSSQAPVAQTKVFMNAREVMEFLCLKPGEYLIVPSTFHPDQAASFILTLLSRTETHCYENSREFSPEPEEKALKVKNRQQDGNTKGFFCQYSDENEEVDAEQLQRILNENLLKEDLRSGGFSIDACRSMVALMDTSISGKLNREEFLRLWNKVLLYKDVFFQTDVSRTGTLSLTELRNALVASGMRVSDDTLNLMALRYGASSGHVTLESFISLVLRLERMFKIFRQLSDGKTMSLQESEWIYISMYT